MTDLTIIRRVQAGDLALFGELHKRYYRRVWGYVFRCLNNEETAKDIASDTFIRAYRAIGHYEPRDEKSFGPFLLRIARNLIIDHQRREKPWMLAPLESEEGHMPELADSGPSLLERILREEKADRVRAALGRLPVADREILALAYQQGLSLKEIQQVTEKPSVSAVTSHLHRAVQKLRNEIRGDEYFESESQLSNQGPGNDPEAPRGRPL